MVGSGTSRASIYNGFTSIDLLSGFTQLEIAREEKRKTACRDAHGVLWGFNGVQVWAANPPFRLCRLRTGGTRAGARKAYAELVPRNHHVLLYTGQINGLANIVER